MQEKDRQHIRFLVQQEPSSRGIQSRQRSDLVALIAPGVKHGKDGLFGPNGQSLSEYIAAECEEWPEWTGNNQPASPPRESQLTGPVFQMEDIKTGMMRADLDKASAAVPAGMEGIGADRKHPPSGTRRAWLSGQSERSTLPDALLNKWVLTVAVFGLLSGAALAKMNIRLISGTVSDASGAVIPRASVVALQRSTQVNSNSMSTGRTVTPWRLLGDRECRRLQTGGDRACRSALGRTGAAQFKADTCIELFLSAVAAFGRLYMVK